MKKKEYKVFVPGNVPSSKNSRQTNMKTGRSFVSKTVARYYKSTEEFFLLGRNAWRRRWDTLSKPWPIYFHFVRGSRHKFDWINPAQTIQDRLTKFDWIDDDNTSVMIPFPLLVDGEWSTINLDEPGCWIYITNIPAQTIQIKSEFHLI